jgi:hypothetical protein
MIGYILTPEQAEQVQGVFINPYCFINCVQDINDVWFFFGNEQDKETFKDSEYMWLFECPQGEYIPKPSPNPFDETTNNL